MTKHPPLVTLVALLFAASAALAQGSGGEGLPDTAVGTRNQPRSGPPAFDDTNTPGWSSMSAEERNAHRQRMQSFKTYNECNAYMSQRMRARPGAGGTTSDATAPGNDACSHLPRG